MTLTTSESIDIKNLNVIISSDELHPTFTTDKNENIHVESSLQNTCTNISSTTGNIYYLKMVMLNVIY